MEQPELAGLMEGLESIPTLPSVAMRLLEIVVDDNSSVKDVAKIIEADAALSAKVLRVINSPAYGLRHKVSTISHAIALLGFASLKSLVLSVSVFDSLLEGKKEGRLDKVVFWQHCLASAASARQIAKDNGYDMPEEAYVAGLLHDIGKLVLDLKLRPGMTRMLKRAKEEPFDLLEMELTELGVHHAEVGSLALQRWGMPELLRMAVLHHHTEELPVDMPLRARLLTSVVSAADFVCWTQGMGSFDARRPPLLPKEAQLRINLDGDAVSKISATIDHEIQAMAEIFHFSAPDAARFRHALQRANLELGRINTLYEEAKRQLERRVKELTELNEAIRTARQTLKPDEIRKAMISAACAGFGIDRAIYFNIDLKVNMVEGVATADSTSVATDIAKLRFAYVPTEPFLAQCRQAGRPFRFAADEPVSIGSKILRYLDAQEMIVVPIMVDGEMRGLVIADNGLSHQPVTDSTLVSLGVLASETGMAIENASLFQKVTELSTTDELTQIFNRRQLAAALGYEMDRSRRYQRPLSIVMCDLDHFKSFNDNYGHLAGDKLLCDIARLIKGSSREVDIVARYGGEEFMVVLPETPKDNAIIYAERVRKAIERFGIGCKHNFPQVSVSISIGVGGFEPAGDKTIDDLIGKADKALYAAKQRGRNMVCVDGQ